MSSAVTELESHLQSMLALKPPGVTRSKVNDITRLCSANIQNEYILIQKLSGHFKAAPGAHKLGVLYVIDSLVRHWGDTTRRNGRPPRSAAPDGTFAAGVDRLTKLMPSLMTDILYHSPPKYREKIKQLVDIWECRESFPPCMLLSFRAKLSASLTIRCSSPPQSSTMLTFNRLGASSLMKLDNNSPLAAAHKISDTINPLIGMAQNDAVNSVSPTTSPAAPVPPAVTNTCSRTSAHATAHSAALRDDSDPKSASLQSQIDYEVGDGQYDIHDHIRRGHEYNQHYPPGKGHPSMFHQPESPQKFIEWDYSVGRGNMKILSRTLFVSGTAAEAQLRSIFEQFGSIQSCVVNSDKCHAFIKMISRQDAVKARTEANWYDSDGIQIRTRWGNGFGPRYCNDYRTGVSVIPLNKLTRGDRKWLLTAEHGGTGGLPLKSGMVVEEPDIEIGAGLSSRSLSRNRTATRSKYGQGSQLIRHRGRSHTERPDRAYADTYRKAGPHLSMIYGS